MTVGSMVQGIQESCMRFFSFQMTVGMEEDTRKLYYLTIGEPFTETNSKNTLKSERYRNFISNSFYFVFIWKEHFLPGMLRDW
jgi:hypothetical protein